jgi:hypothetical protein
MTKIVEKVKRLLECIRAPKYLHHFGPKKYKFWQHVLALFMKQECKLSFRRVSNLLNGFGQTVPSYSALAKMCKRIPLWIWKILLRASANTRRLFVVAIDSVFFSRTNPSFHYLKRVKKEILIAKPVQVSALIDTYSQKVVSLRVRAKRVHDTRDVKYLLKHSPRPTVLVADKAYDSNKIHELAKKTGIITMIPVRKNVRKGFYRNYMKKFFDERAYHLRSLVETAFSCVKRRSGGSVYCRKARQQRAEIYARFITNNLKLVKKQKTFN